MTTQNLVLQFKLRWCSSLKILAFFGCQCPSAQIVTSEVNVGFAVRINEHKSVEKVETVWGGKP